MIWAAIKAVISGILIAAIGSSRCAGHVAVEIRRHLSDRDDAVAVAIAFTVSRAIEGIKQMLSEQTVPRLLVPACYLIASRRRQNGEVGRDLREPCRDADAQDQFRQGQGHRYRQAGGNLQTRSGPRFRVQQDRTLPIRLTHLPTTCGMLPFPRVEFVKGRCADVASDAE